jgi:hypothetical protein
MKRRSKASGAKAKTGRRKAARPKRRKAASGSRRRSSTAGEQTDVARLRRELGGALERQAATSEVLNLISQSPTNTQPVFDAIASNVPCGCAMRYLASSGGMTVICFTTRRATISHPMSLIIFSKRTPNGLTAR